MGSQGRNGEGAAWASTSFIRSSIGKLRATSKVGDHVTDALVGQGQGVSLVLSLGACLWRIHSIRTAESFKSGRGASLGFRTLLRGQGRSPGSRGGFAGARVTSGQGAETEPVPWGQEADGMGEGKGGMRKTGGSRALVQDEDAAGGRSGLKPGRQRRSGPRGSAWLLCGPRCQAWRHGREVVPSGHRVLPST